ncbi:MAG: hypothetical protein ACPGYT_07835, partial [Nitrospirales bacterium]
ELIGRYSVNQRTKSYAELARLVGGQNNISYPGVGVVVALTEDFQQEVLEGKGDMVKIPKRLQVDSSEANKILVEQAEIGMKLVESRRIPIEGPTENLIQETHKAIRSLHVQAHNWRDWDHAAIVPHIEVVSGTRMREYVKSWITALDLKRLVPDESVEIEVANFESHYEEDQVLAAVTQEDSDQTEGESQDPESERVQTSEEMACSSAEPMNRPATSTLPS